MAIGVSDLAAVGESISIALDALSVGVSDAVAVAESVESYEFVIRITVGGVNVTDLVPFHGGELGLPGLTVEQRSEGGFVAVCEFGLEDDANTVAISVGDVVIVESGETLFRGQVAAIEEWLVGLIHCWAVRCQDDNVLLQETVVASASYVAGTADSAIIDDLFSSYLSSIDSTTEVDTVDSAMAAIIFEEMTIREALDQICGLTGATYYVDFESQLHYFSAENDAAAFALSDAPDFASTFPYGELQRSTDGTAIIDKVRVVGDGVTGWVGSGDHEAVVQDQEVTTAGGVTSRGTATLAQYQSAQVTYSCVVWGHGLRAGQDVAFTNAVLGLSAETLTIRESKMTCLSTEGTHREYTLRLGTPVAVLDSDVIQQSVQQEIRNLYNRTVNNQNNVSDIYDDFYSGGGGSSGGGGGGGGSGGGIPMRVPIGMIAMWSGAIGSLPLGWSLCDGSNGTPNLADKFVLGAGGAAGIGDTGGEDESDLSHTHGPGTLETDADTHDHAVNAGLTASDTHDHAVNAGVTASDSHDHGNTGGYEEPETLHGGAAGSDFSSLDVSHTHDIPSDSHTHGPGSLDTDSDSHTHGPGSLDTDNDIHDHVIDAGLTATGGLTTHENRPAFYALAFIMFVGAPGTVGYGYVEVGAGGAMSEGVGAGESVGVGVV